MSFNLTRYLPLLACCLIGAFAVAFPDAVHAFTDGADQFLPESRKDKPLLENVVWIALLAALFFIAAVMFFGVGDLILGLFSSLQDARRTGDWGPFLRTLGIVLVILIVTFFVAAFIFNLATGGLTFNPSVNVG